MTIPITNVSFQNIQDEFAQGAVHPISLTEYYRGGTYVPLNQGDAGYGLIKTGPAPALIDVGPFRNQTYAPNFVFNDVVSVNTANYNLSTRASNAGWNGTTPLAATITVNGGVYVYGSTPATPALTIGSLPSGSTVSLINNGFIAGAGGNGGTGGGVASNSLTEPTNGANGGTALTVSWPVTVTNNGTIGGGGGGGGGGGAAYRLDKSSYHVANGGGGGGGRALGFAGANGNISGDILYGVSSPPGNATFAAAGVGGTGATTGQPTGGNGGSGGDLGSQGNPGTLAGGTFDARTGAGTGGLAGNAVVGGANITWNAFGNRFGPIDHLGINNTGGGVAARAGGYTDHVTIAPNQALTWVNVYTNGDLRTFRFGNNLVLQQPWFSPLTAGIGVSYWVRATLISGQTNNGVGDDVLNVWLQLNATRSWSYSVTNTVRTGILRIQISSSASGTPILSSADYDFYSESSL